MKDLNVVNILHQMTNKLELKTKDLVYIQILPQIDAPFDMSLYPYILKLSSHHYAYRPLQLLLLFCYCGYAIFLY